jgi:hypothetical protein
MALTKTRTALLVAAAALAALIFATMGVLQFVKFGSYGGPNEMFGDQNLKTTVALLELHHTRNGSYPRKLGDLEYTGAWDQNALHAVRYCPSDDLSAYYVEVAVGFIGKPNLTLPPEFWRGTGYRPELARACP